MIIINGLQTEENFYNSNIIAKTVWNARLEFLCYRIEIKMGVILRCKLVTHNKQISKLSCVILFQIFFAMFLPTIS